MVAGSSSNVDDRAGVKPGVLVAAVAFLILLLGILAWRYFGPGKEAGRTGTHTAQQQADQDWLKQKARESGGDFNRLSPEDQRRLTTLYGNMGPSVLRGTAHPASSDY
jgi:hypothetical protein